MDRTVIIFRFSGKIEKSDSGYIPDDIHQFFSFFPVNLFPDQGTGGFDFVV